MSFDLLAISKAKIRKDFTMNNRNGRQHDQRSSIVFFKGVSKRFYNPTIASLRVLWTSQETSWPCRL
jgi:hypothetical protein